MPVEQGPFEHIVNVQWGAAGLAVEFGDHAQDAPKPPDSEEK